MNIRIIFFRREYDEVHFEGVEFELMTKHPLPNVLKSLGNLNLEVAIWIWEELTLWFQIGKGVCQGCILSLFLFSLYAEYIMRNTGLEEAQAGNKIAGRNINNLRYADDHPYGRK